MSIILFLIILGILVVSHEFGHFIVAKLSGMRVDEFGFGFPPKLFGFKYGETTYSINLIPFGGFVKIWGEDAPAGADQLPDYDRSFVGKSKGIQAAVVVAGVAFNLLLAWGLISLGLMVGMPTPASDTTYGPVENPEVIITEVLRGTPAENAGLLPGDRVITLERNANETLTPHSAADVQEFIRANETEPVTIRYKRGDADEASLILTPEKGIAGEFPAIGVAMETLGIVRLPFFSAIIEGAKLTVDFTKSTITGLYALVHDLIFGRGALDSVTGPIGLVGLVGTSAALGFTYLLGLTAIISINLAVMNLIPFPALDGGRLLFIIIEKIKGTPVPPKVANSIHAAGFLILLLFMAFITWHDIAKLIAA